jgi:hypothetical protein
MDCRSRLSLSGRQYITVRTTLLNKKDYTSKMATIGHISATLCNYSPLLSPTLITDGAVTAETGGKQQGSIKVGR